MTLTSRPDRPARPVRRTLPALVVTATLVVGVLLALGLHSSTDSTGLDESTGPMPTTAPALSGPTLDGRPFDLATARGQVVLVNVFASWCGPCRDELPVLLGAQRRWAPRGLRVVGLNLRDGTEAVRALLQETGAQELTVVPDPDGTRAVAWGVRGVPETFVVDRDGRIRDRRQGAVTRQWLEQRVEPLLAG